MHDCIEACVEVSGAEVVNKIVVLDWVLSSTIQRHSAVVEYNVLAL